MNKIRVIDILNKIANGEEVPKKILLNRIVFEYQGDDYLYKDEDKKEYWLFSACYTDKYMWLEDFLKDEVEIIENPKKINKIRIDHNSINIDKAFETGTTTFFREKDIEIFQCLSSKINELIDEINNLKDK